MKILIIVSLLFAGEAMAGIIHVKVNGMVCSMCAQGIQKKFSSESSIKKLDVNLDEKSVHIETHDGKDVSDQKIRQVINEAGYHVASIERK